MNRLRYAKKRRRRSSWAMYPIEYTWMSVPTPVMSSTNRLESVSNVNAKSTWKWPASIHVPSEVVTERSPASRPSSSTNMIAPSTNDAAEHAEAIRWPKASDSLPQVSRRAAPASGMAMSSQDRSSNANSLGLQQVRVVDRGRAARAIDGHDDGQPDGDLGGGDDHDEERRDLSVEVAVLAGERHEREVRGVQHELDAHEHDDRVAAHQHADRADREQQRREGDVFGHWSSPSVVSGFSVVAGRSSGPRPVASIWATARSASSAPPCGRGVSVPGTDSGSGVPSGSRAGVSTAL